MTFCASNTCSPWLCCNGYGRHGSAVGPGEACVGRRTRGPSTTLSPSGAVAVSRCAAHTAAPARSVGSAPCWRLRGNGGRSHDARGVDGDGEGTERTRRHCSRERGSGRAENRGGVGEWERRLARGDTANADRSLRPSLPCPPSCVAVLARPTLRHTSDATSYLFILTPRSSPPITTHPSVRLHRTMSLYGTSRVCVLECPPLGRPSF